MLFYPRNHPLGFIFVRIVQWKPDTCMKLTKQWFPTSPTGESQLPGQTADSGLGTSVSASELSGTSYGSTQPHSQILVNTQPQQPQHLPHSLHSHQFQPIPAVSMPLLNQEFSVDLFVISFILSLKGALDKYNIIPQLSAKKLRFLYY